MKASEERIRTVVAQQAGTWFIANRSGSLAPDERAAFVTWLKASPIHVEEYLGVALVAHDLPAAAEDPDLSLESLIESARADDTDVVSLEAPSASREPATRRAPLRWSLAASVAAVVLVAAASVLWWTDIGELLGIPKSYRTAHGEQSVVRLPDGSELRLNTDTAVTVRYSRNERVVDIARGQALMTVARDERRRFRVVAGDAQVLAVGTRFDVYRKAEGTVVTVVEGIVAMLTGQPSPGSPGLAPDAFRVEAGYQVHVDATGVASEPVPVDVQQAVAWLERKIAFERRPLGEVADEFNRYGRIAIEIEDAALRDLPITGVFGAYDVDSFVAFLRTLEGVRVERTAASIRVSSMKPQKE